jgi:Flp pilus assembly protein TadG
VPNEKIRRIPGMMADPDRPTARRTQLPAAADKAQAMAEFALVLTTFILLIFGAMYLAQAVYAYNYVAYAAREGSRYAAVHGYDSYQVASASTIDTFVKGETAGLDTSKLTVTTTWTPDNKAGSVVQVEVQYQLSLSIPFIPAQTLSLTSMSKMVMS